jgi:hypothetical protein
MKYFELFMGWLIPGSCYWMKGDRLRGTYIFILLQGSFLIGLMLNGSVHWPAWSPKTEGFNLINILTYLTQMGNGLFATLSMIADWEFVKRLQEMQSIGNNVSINEIQNSLGALKIFHGNEISSTFELGSFYLLVAGAMNYFSVVGYWDRYYGAQAKEQNIENQRQAKGA